MSVYLMSNDGSTSCFLDQELMAYGKKFILQELLLAWVAEVEPEFSWAECPDDGYVLWRKVPLRGDFMVLWSDSVFKMVRRLAAMGKLPGRALR